MVDIGQTTASQTDEKESTLDSYMAWSRKRKAIVEERILNNEKRN